MTAGRPTGAGRAWELIDVEKRRDRTIRRICVAAWSFTFGLVVLFAIMLAFTLVPLVRAMSGGDVPLAAVVGGMMPLMGVLWTLSLLIAALSTVAVFLRMRTTSLAEIQLRLSALEEMIAERGDGS